MSIKIHTSLGIAVLGFFLIFSKAEATPFTVTSLFGDKDNGVGSGPSPTDSSLFFNASLNHTYTLPSVGPKERLIIESATLNTNLFDVLNMDVEVENVVVAQKANG